MKTRFLDGTWGAAVLIGIFTAFGLVLALLGEGMWDWLSMIGLGVPLIVALRCGLKRAKPKGGDVMRRTSCRKP